MKFFGSAALFIIVALFFSQAAAGAEKSRSVIPLTVTEDQLVGGRIYLPVRIGSVLGKMRLDTGASSTRIRLASWNKDFPTLGESVSTGASGATMQCQDVAAPQVELVADQGNNIARKNYELTRCPAGGDDDLLGIDFFRGARFSLDIERHELIFFGDALGRGRPRPFRRLGPGQRLVGLDLRFGRTPAVGLFDSGAEISAVDQRFVRRHKRLFAAVNAKAKASLVGGKRISLKFYKIKSLDLGDGLVLRDIYAMSYDFGALRAALGRNVHFLIGYNLIRNFDWDLDFSQPDSPTWDAKLK
ncbi:MAG: aspartyl protease family protein [Methylocystis sp.]|uniref:aspartyl protease family protein n=1 Tax=Methylocystis sp. TaxID=1911079 RepID=UPI003D134E09